MVESLRDILSKSVTRAPGTYTPSTSIIRITPKQITHRPFVWDLLDPVYPSYIVKGVYARGEPPVQAEYLIVNERRQRKIVEEVGKVFPDVSVAVLS